MAAAPQPSFAAAPVMPTVANTGLPAGTMLLTAGQMAQLYGAAGGGSITGQQVDWPQSGSRRTTWNGSTKPDPISVNEVSYEKGPGRLSKAELSSAIDSAMDKTGITDPAARAKWKPVLEFMAENESGGDTNAVNLSDSNAVGPTAPDGHPGQSSRGPWQTIPTTFAANHAAGTSNSIYDAEASAGAAINYMKERYQVGADGSGLDQFAAARQAGGYTGY